MSATNFHRDRAAADDGGDAAARCVRERAPAAAPAIGVILGSGWSELGTHVQQAVRIPYDELPGFPRADVPGHRGELLVGRIGAHQVAVMSGRKHAYEDGDVAAMKAPIAALQALGCRVLVQTNAAGSLHPGMMPGSLMVLADHLNPSQRSPLVGEGGTRRFVDMVDAYDPDLRALALRIAAERELALFEGVYAWTLGPQFETPAEIRMFRALGADAVGMSTVPETILARYFGLRVLAFSLITNLAAGLSAEPLSHANTLAQAQAASGRASRLLADVIAALQP